MSEFKTVGLTEDMMKKIISLPYQLLAMQKSEELGCEISVTTFVERKEDAS